MGAGECFIFVADRRQPATVNASNEKLSDAERRGILECEISFGRMSGGDVPWQILDSTLPGRVGKAFLGPDMTAKGLWELYTDGRQLLAGAIPPAEGWQMQDGRQE